MVSSGLLRRVALVRTDVSEELSSSIIRVTIGELGTTLAVNSNGRALRRNCHVKAAVWAAEGVYKVLNGCKVPTAKGDSTWYEPYCNPHDATRVAHCKGTPERIRHIPHQHTGMCVRSSCGWIRPHLPDNNTENFFAYEWLETA
jgi:hypothetical protein